MPYELVVDGETKPMDEVRYLLSPQDLAAVDLIPDLINQGVVSYKIEGRLKSPDYVAAVTKVYRKAIDDAVANRPSSIEARDRYALEMTFSRGLSTGWLEGTNHPKLTHGKFGKKRGQFCGQISACGDGWIELSEMQGIPLAAGDGVVFDAGEDRNIEQGGRIWKVENHRVFFHRKHSKIDWARVSVGNKIWKTDDPKLNSEVRSLWKNAKLSTVKTPIIISISGKQGEKDTQYNLKSIDNRIEGDVFLPLSELNKLRRKLTDKLDKNKPKDEYTPSNIGLSSLLPEPSDPTDSDLQLSTLCRHHHQIEAALEAGIRTIYADFEDIRKYKDAVQLVRSCSNDTRIHLATPRIQKPQEKGFFSLIKKCEPDGVLINCTNPVTANILKQRANLDLLTPSYDLNIEQLIDLIGGTPADWFEVTLHQHMPMFHMEHCVFCTFLSEGTSVKDCGKPCEKHNVQLRDRVGQLHTLMADVGCRNTLFNGRAQTGARYFSSLKQAGVRKYRCDFTNEDKSTTLHTLKSYHDLLAGTADANMLWKSIGAIDRLGVTEGTLAT